jgi:hypothetical protein
LLNSTQEDARATLVVKEACGGHLPRAVIGRAVWEAAEDLGSSPSPGAKEQVSQADGMRRNPPRYSDWTVKATFADVAACRIISRVASLGLP